MTSRPIMFAALLHLVLLATPCMWCSLTITTLRVSRVCCSLADIAGQAEESQGGKEDGDRGCSWRREQRQRLTFAHSPWRCASRQCGQSGLNRRRVLTQIPLHLIKMRLDKFAGSIQRRTSPTRAALVSMNTSTLVCTHLSTLTRASCCWRAWRT